VCNRECAHVCGCVCVCVCAPVVQCVTVCVCTQADLDSQQLRVSEHLARVRAEKAKGPPRATDEGTCHKA